MKREKARLEALRSMPYEEYIQTPEWQETQKGALKKAGNHCQVCRAENVSLNTYHTTLDSIGCEQEGDVMTLCLACYDRLYQQLAGQEDATNEAEGQPSPDFSFTKKAAVFAPSAIIGLGLPALLHAPLPAEIFGLAAAVALAVNSPKIYAEMRGSLPEPIVEFLDRRAERKRARAEAGEWSNWDRFIGRHMHGDAPKDEQEATAPGGEENGQELRGLVKLAHDLQIPLIDIAGKALFVVGMRRSGKSTLAALLAEQLGQYLLPMLIPDFEGDLLSLAEVLPRVLIMHGPLSDATKYQNEKRQVLTLQVSVQMAPKWGYAIFEKGYQVLLDLASYSTLEEAIAIQIALIRGMFTWAEEHPDGRTTSLVYLDEAQRYLPEALKDSVIQDKALVGELLRVYGDIVAIGGKRGIAPVVITQRMAQVNKKIVNQSEVFFVLRQTSDNDLDRVSEYVNKDTATRQQINKFAQGQGVYIAFDGSQRLTKFDQRISSGKRSETPEPQVAQRYAHVPMELSADQLSAWPSQNQPTTAQTRVLEPSREATIDALLQLQGKVDEQTFLALLDMLPTIRTEDSEAEAVATRKLPDDQKAPRQSHSRALNPALQLAYDAYRPGMKHHSLARCLGVTPATAGQLLQRLHDHGYIDAAGRKTYEQLAPPQKENQGAQEEYDQAIAVWNSLEADQRNVRDFAVAMKLGETKAWQLLSKLERLELIQWERRKKKGMV